MATSTTSTNASNLHVYYEKKLLSTLEPRLVLFNLGKKQRLPKGNGKQVKWLRYSRIESSVTPLTEGTAPSEISFTTANVTADVQQFGQFVKISDLLSDTAIDPVMENVMERLGRAAATTIEDLIVAELDAQAAIQRVNNRANDDAIVAGDVLNHQELIEAMISQKADFIGPHESGSYVAVIHPSNQYDLLVDTDTGSWLDINKYVSPAQEKLMNGEFGRLYGARLLVSDRMTDADNAGAPVVNVKKNYVIGEEAFGVVELDGRSLEMIMKDHKSGGVSNPLNQFATVGYKIHGFKAKYLDNATKRAIQIRAASAL
jgi:N4-gp56 family major capsid protein